jgi:hypothetical protein
VRALTELRAALGASVSADLVRTVVDPEFATNLLRLLDQHDEDGE